MAEHLPGYSEWEVAYYWWFGDEETRDANASMEKAAEKAAVELEKIPSISFVLEEMPLFSSKHLHVKQQTVHLEDRHGNWNKSSCCLCLYFHGLAGEFNLVIMERNPTLIL